MPGRTTLFLQFIHHEPEGPRKTSLVNIRSVRTSYHLGTIKWYSPWRQYCFYPEEGTVWNTQCMTEVTEEIRALMEARKEKP